MAAIGIETMIPEDETSTMTGGITETPKAETMTTMIMKHMITGEPKLDDTMITMIMTIVKIERELREMLEITRTDLGKPEDSNGITM